MARDHGYPGRSYRQIILTLIYSIAVYLVLAEPQVLLVKSVDESNCHRISCHFAYGHSSVK